MKRIVVLGIAGLLACAASASAAWSENFDSYADQAAFDAAWPQWGTWSPARTQNLLVGYDHTTGTGNSVFGLSVCNDNISYRAKHNIGDLTDYKVTGVANTWGEKPLVVTWWFEDTMELTAGTLRKYESLYAYSGNAGSPPNYGAAGWSLAGYIQSGIYHPTSPTKYSWRNTGTWAATSVNRTAGWHEFKVEVFPTKTDLYIDGVLAATGAKDNTIYSWDTFIIGEGYTSAQDAAVDDISVTPEPATLLMLAAGGLLLRRRRA